ncbi:MAG: alpha/beta hydrolase [Oscillospiraceae bacterium]|nr:alpha/beta hydrolase [Oscillospiraceae bacterium]
MHGDKDSVVPIAYSQKADKIYRIFGLELFGGEGHGFFADADKQMTQMLVRFIKDIVLY